MAEDKPEIRAEGLGRDRMAPVVVVAPRPRRGIVVPSPNLTSILPPGLIVDPQWALYPWWLGDGLTPKIVGAYYQYADGYEGDCGGSRDIKLPRSFAHVSVQVTNDGQCPLTVTITSGFGNTPDEKMKGKTTVQPKDGFGHDGEGQVTGDDGDEVTFTCAGKDGQCNFSFSISAHS